MIKNVLLGLLFGYITILVIMYFFQSSFIYYPSGVKFGDCDFFFENEVKTYEGVNFYHKKGSSDKTVVIYHGNAGSSCDRAFYLSFLPEEHSYIIFNYPGYGDGRKTSKDAIFEDVEKLVSYLENESVFLLGESIGSSVAGYHASISNNVEKIVLLSPFYSLEKVAKDHYSFLPVSLLLREDYKTYEYLENYDNDLLIIHGEDDNIVPLDHSTLLVEQFNFRREIISGAGHNDLIIRNDVQELLKNELK